MPLFSNKAISTVMMTLTSVFISSNFFQRGAAALRNGSTRNSDTHHTLSKVKAAIDHDTRYTCSSSTSVPQKSFGCKNSTGLPCAPIFGWPSPSTRAPDFTNLSRAAMMSVTS